MTREPFGKAKAFPDASKSSSKWTKEKAVPSRPIGLVCPNRLAHRRQRLRRRPDPGHRRAARVR